jgi:hypothetical protein
MFMPDAGFRLIPTARYLPSSSIASASNSTSVGYPTPSPTPVLNQPSGQLSVDIAVRATRQFKVGQMIHRLCGALATMDEDHIEAVNRRKDFSSVVIDGKKGAGKRTQLFLGPARFVNHDCKPNVQLGTYNVVMMTKYGKTSRKVFCYSVIRDIKPGDEIVSFYGKNYFEDGNKSCKCGSCEK